MAQSTERRIHRFEQEEIFEANAARKLNTLPERDPHRRPERKNNVVKISDEELRKARRQGLNPLRCVVSVLCVAVVFTLVATVIYGQVQLTELTEKINTAETNLAQLESVEVQLQMKNASAMNLETIAEYAQESLGMEKIKDSQIVYINLAQQDTGTVVQKTDESFFGRLWSGITSWWS